MVSPGLAGAVGAGAAVVAGGAEAAVVVGTVVSGAAAVAGGEGATVVAGAAVVVGAGAVVVVSRTVVELRTVVVGASVVELATVVVATTVVVAAVVVVGASVVPAAAVVVTSESDCSVMSATASAVSARVVSDVLARESQPTAPREINAITTAGDRSHRESRLSTYLILQASAAVVRGTFVPKPTTSSSCWWISCRRY